MFASGLAGKAPNSRKQDYQPATSSQQSSSSASEQTLHPKARLDPCSLIAALSHRSLHIGAPARVQSENCRADTDGCTGKRPQVQLVQIRAGCSHNLTPASCAQAGQTLPCDPHWVKLPLALWHHILLSARGSLRPVCGSELGAGLHDSRWTDWVAWWRLLAVASSACRDLHEAVFGPGSEVLWTWGFLQGPDGNCAPSTPSLSQRQQRGLRQMLLTQAPHATSVLITGADFWEDRSLQAVTSQLRSVPDLTLWGFWPEYKTLIVFTALPCQLRALTLTGRALHKCNALSGLEYLCLRCMSLSEEQLRGLGLPTSLQRLRLELLSLKHTQIRFVFQVLSVLPVAELELQLTCCSRDIPKRLTSRLRQLAGVHLAVLELRCLEGALLTAEHCSLLSQLQVTDRVVTRCSDETRHLQALPASVVCRRLD